MIEPALASMAVPVAALTALQLRGRRRPPGRHRVTSQHVGWETALEQLAQLALCGDPNPWDNRITCTHKPRHDGRHEANGPVRWNDNCHFPGDDCGPNAHAA